MLLRQITENLRSSSLYITICNVQQDESYVAYAKRNSLTQSTFIKSESNLKTETTNSLSRIIV
ncbi:hypothetical protein HI914_04739 [Erysiphe necator]|nr:hypothetical protein HI914_04739 [Erysiphe necator]